MRKNKLTLNSPPSCPDYPVCPHNRKGVYQRQLCRRIFAIWTFSSIPPDKFDTKLANFFKIGVTCYSKGNTFNFSYFFFSFIAKIITQLFFAAAVSEPEASERGSSLIGKKLHYKGIQSLFLTKRKELWLCAT